MGGSLPPAHDGGTLVAVFPPVGARHKHRLALGTGPHLSSVEQSGAQPLIRWQNSGAEPLADEGIVNALNAGTGGKMQSTQVVKIIWVQGFKLIYTSYLAHRYHACRDKQERRKPSKGFPKEESFCSKSG